MKGSQASPSPPHSMNIPPPVEQTLNLICHEQTDPLSFELCYGATFRIDTVKVWVYTSNTSNGQDVYPMVMMDCAES